MRALALALSAAATGLLLFGGPAGVRMQGRGVPLDHTFKVAYYNIQSGMGIPQLTGTCSFERNSNCTDPRTAMNAWGMGVVQVELDRALNSDPGVIALGLAEAWSCASPSNVRNALGWAAHTGERNGVSLVARHGFAGPAEWYQLDTSLNPNPADTMWVVRAPVCADATCSQSIEVFSAHWYASGETKTESFERQARETVAFMDRLPAMEPRVLIGDLNVWEEEGLVCSQAPTPTAVQIMRDAGNVDAWRSVHGTAEGYTGMWNRNGCGDPNGNLWKRIDYGWSKALPPPVGMTRFGMVTPGACAPSDHAGVIIEYPWPGADTTAPAVALITPAEGAILSGTTTVATSASDAGGVTRVGFTVDGTLVTEDSVAPYEFPWNTTSVANGAHTLAAWAEDSAGNRGTSATIGVWVDNGSPNSAPLASFSVACINLDCAFSDTSTDAEGPLAAWSWAFGDGGTSSAQNPGHRYAAGGTYTASLTVTDSNGATSTTSRSVTVSAAFDFSLSVSPTSKRTRAGAKTSYTVSTTLVGGSATGVTLSVSGLPAGTTAAFDPPSITGSGSSRLTITVGTSTATGTYPLTVIGTGGGLTRSAAVSLEVAQRR